MLGVLATYVHCFFLYSHMHIVHVQMQSMNEDIINLYCKYIVQYIRVNNNSEVKRDTGQI